MLLKLKLQAIRNRNFDRIAKSISNRLFDSIKFSVQFDLTLINDLWLKIIDTVHREIEYEETELNRGRIHPWGAIEIVWIVGANLIERGREKEWERYRNIWQAALIRSDCQQGRRGKSREMKGERGEIRIGIWIPKLSSWSRTNTFDQTTLLLLLVFRYWFAGF